MCTQNHYLSANDARKLTNNIDTNNNMETVMEYIKDAIIDNENHIDIDYNTFYDIEQNLIELGYNVSSNKIWMTITW